MNDKVPVMFIGGIAHGKVSYIEKDKIYPITLYSEVKKELNKKRKSNETFYHHEKIQSNCGLIETNLYVAHGLCLLDIISKFKL